MTELSVETLHTYTEQDAHELGHLMKSLTGSYDGRPVDQELLEVIIGSPDADQLVARLRGRIVGAATLSTVMGPVAGRVGYLNDFVTDAEVQGQGVGSRLWGEIERWCIERDVPLIFTSRESRQAAHTFYTKQGAEIVDTTAFRFDPSKSYMTKANPTEEDWFRYNRDLAPLGYAPLIDVDVRATEAGMSTDDYFEQIKERVGPLEGAELRLVSSDMDSSWHIVVTETEESESSS